MTHETVEKKGRGTAVLFFHGILGTPHHFDGLFPLVPPEWGICAPLLVGHGKTADDFSAATMADWKRQTHALVQQAAAQYDTVLLVGHSMGTLFALDEARQCPKVKGLFLLAVPLRVRLKKKAVLSACAVGLGKVSPGDASAVAAQRAYSIAPERRLWKYLRWVPNYRSLFSQIRRTRRLLPEVSVPVWVMQSAGDEMAALSSLDILQENPHVRAEILPASFHSEYAPEDFRHIQERFAQFLQKYSSSGGFID